jgi:hypothetical protein
MGSVSRAVTHDAPCSIEIVRCPHSTPRMSASQKALMEADRAKAELIKGLHRIIADETKHRDEVRMLRSRWP